MLKFIFYTAILSFLLITNIAKCYELNNEICYQLSSITKYAKYVEVKDDGTRSLFWINKPTQYPKITLWDEFFYQPIIFAGADSFVGNFDIYFSKIRLQKDGKILAIRDFSNLTNSPDGNDIDLTIHNNKAAFKTLIDNKCQSISIIDLKNFKKKVFLITRPVANVNLNWTTVKDTATLEVSIHLLESNVIKSVKINSETGSMNPNSDLLIYQPNVKGESEFIRSVVNFVRDNKILSVEQVAWLESFFYAWADKYNKFRYNVSNKNPVNTNIIHIDSLIVPNKNPLTETTPDILLPITPIIKDNAYKDEGIWTTEGMPKSNKDFPIIAKTFIRPDPERPYAFVYMVIFDLNQTRLHLVGGTKEPKSTTGITGTGMIPKDANVRKNLIFAFNGAFQAKHGAYGMIADRVLYLPPKDSCGTIAIYEDGSVKIGEWMNDILPDTNIVSLRQNLSVLIHNGVFNPKKRVQWGLVYKGDTPVHCWRSALGITRNNKLIFALGNPVSPETLARALMSAGVISAVHLDMNGANSYCEVYNVRDNANGGYTIEAEKPYDKIWGKAPHYLGVEEEDFFYVVRN